MATEGGARPHREDSGFLMEEGPIFSEGLDQASVVDAVFPPQQHR